MNSHKTRIFLMTAARLIVSVAIISMLACERKPKTATFTVGIDNRTADTFEEAYVEGQGFRSIVNFVPSGGGFSDGPIFAEPPDVFIVRWIKRNEPDRQYEVEVDLADHLPEKFYGTIYFQVNQDYSISVQLDRFGDESPPSEPFGRFVENISESIDVDNTNSNSDPDN